jgi:hypothetical protein
VARLAEKEEEAETDELEEELSAPEESTEE